MENLNAAGLDLESIFTRQSLLAAAGRAEGATS